MVADKIAYQCKCKMDKWEHLYLVPRCHGFHLGSSIALDLVRNESSITYACLIARCSEAKAS